MQSGNRGFRGSDIVVGIDIVFAMVTAIIILDILVGSDSGCGSRGASSSDAIDQLGYNQLDVLIVAVAFAIEAYANDGEPSDGGHASGVGVASRPGIVGVRMGAGDDDWRRH